MAYNSKYNKKSDDGDEKKKPISAKERYEAYLERDRKLNELLEGISEEDISEVDMSKMSAKERYAVYMGREAQARRQAEEKENAADTADVVEDTSATADANGEEKSEEQVEDNTAVEGTDEGEIKEEPKKSDTYERPKSAGGADDDIMKRAIIRRIIFSVAFAGAAIALQLITFHVPFTPSNFSIEFSALPEIFAAITYGPITGIVIVIVKNIAYMLINHNAVATALSNIILDTVFVVIAGMLYSKSVFMKAKSNKPLNKKQVKRRVNLSRVVNALGGGIVGGIVTSILSFFVLNYITFPLIFRKYPPDVFTQQLIDQYQAGLNGLNGYLPSFLVRVTEIHSLMQGTLVFNIGITFSKYLLVTLMTAIIYPIASDFLHYRK